MAGQGISKSAFKLVPSDPSSAMVIRDITPNITTFSTPFLRMGLIKIGGRGTIVKLKSGNLAVFSPVALTSEVKSKVSSMGTMKYLVAPDYEHHIFLGPWAKEYPDAQVVGVEGLPEKREKDGETAGTKFAHVFTKSNKRDYRVGADFDDEFEYEYMNAHPNKELVFLHKPSRTMIQADLMFNLPATEQFSRTGIDPTKGIMMKVVNGLMNLQGDAKWQKRFLWYAISAPDRKGFAESFRRMRQWDFDRMIPCHGDVIETGAKGVFENITEWFKDVK